jgi:hypothetical protein
MGCPWAEHFKAADGISIIAMTFFYGNSRVGHVLIISDQFLKVFEFFEEFTAYKLHLSTWG